MFLNKNYILANELVQKMGINIANISVLLKRFEDDDDFTTMMKMNNCTMIKSNSHKLPRNIAEGIAQFEFTDLTDKLPCPYIRTEYGFSEKELTTAGIITDKIKIAKKEFYVFDKEFVNKVRNKIVYPLSEVETMSCYRAHQIEGYIKAAKNKYITWY